MSLFTRRAAIAPVAALLLLAACQTNASPSASAAGASQGASTAPSVAPSVAATPVAQVPSDQLTFAGKLVICSDIPYPPQEFFDADGNPVGSDIELGEAIAGKLGLTPQIENSVFDTIIAAVTTGKCDIIISAQNITAERVAQVDMIPYFKAGQSFVVAKGNPKAINTTDDLCGKSIAAESSTTEVDYLNGTGSYAGKGLSAACVTKGLAKITVSEYQKDSDALAALSSGNVDAYFADSPVAGYYTVQHPDQFVLSGVPPLDTALEGISVPKEKTALRDGVVAALKALMADGGYTQILTKYAIETGGLTAADVVPVTK
jgi:polar amino acid transport system substrate-binding protein